VGLLGTNGAGKSTLLKAVAGLVRHEEGLVLLGGEDVTALEPEQRVGRGLALVQGGAGVFPGLTVRDHLRAATWREKASLPEAIARTGALFPGLAAKLDVKADRLSGGERQMLTLAQSLVRRPRVLLVDELSIGLSPAVVSGLVEVLRELLAGGVAMVVAEQSINVAAAVASRALFLERGRVRASGSLEDIRAADVLRVVLLR
jgi:ABC-type branched-subunit amino acid transport system ATPase component